MIKVKALPRVTSTVRMELSLLEQVAKKVGDKKRYASNNDFIVEAIVEKLNRGE